ncbi:MAG: ABC transporter substrate-binding protein [Beijerinckiaceae bacterium]|nr:ABC transporter substrate-binding protein [Beijerinckiaceae bacterium]MCZ8300279.1 ABC transporter substrate-binding protein [Beijerinckiaceae bacterium]
MRLVRRLVVVAGLGLTAISLAGLPALAQKRGGTLVQITQPEPPTLGSYVSTANPVGQVASKIYDGLLEYDFDLKPLPSLAESWTVAEDGKTVTFKLRAGVKFHDGKPFTSADVQYTFMDVLKKVHPRGINTFAEVTAVETPDPQTAIFRLNRPAPYMMAALSGYESPILPKHVFSQGDIRTHQNANSPVGTGPFKFVEWRRGEFVRLDRNADYWKPGLPYLDRIVVRFIGDTGTRAAALEKGEAHIAGFGAVPYNDVKKLEKLPNIQIVTKGYEMLSPVVELMFNTKKAPFDNAKVRQAISYAIDRKFVIDNIWFGFGKPTNGPISSNFAPTGLYSADVTNYNVPDGVERANKLLDEAGFPRKADGIRFEITHDITPYGEEWRRFGEYTQQALAKIGIKANLRYEDVATWLKRIYTDYDYDVSSNHLFNLADPVLGVHRAFHSRFIRPGTVFVNGVRWSTPQTDELMDRATIEPDAKKRAALYAEVQKIVVDQAPLAWTHEISFATVLDKRYRDVIVSPLGLFSSFDRAWRE